MCSIFIVSKSIKWALRGGREGELGKALPSSETVRWGEKSLAPFESRSAPHLWGGAWGKGCTSVNLSLLPYKMG